MSGIFNAVLGATRKLVKTLSGATDEEEPEIKEEPQNHFVSRRRTSNNNNDDFKSKQVVDENPKWISSRRKRSQTPEVTESVVVPTKKPKSKETPVEVEKLKPQEKVEESDTEEIDANLLQKLIKEAQEWKEKQKKEILDKSAPVDLLRSSGSFRKEKPLREVKTDEIWKMPPTMKLSLKSLLPPYYKDSWDSYHVKMPCSPKNLYQKDNSSRALSKWYQICSVLSVPIHHSKELQDAIHTINEDINDFDTLHYVINEALSEEQATKFLSKTLPQIAYLAMKLPDICPDTIPLLIPDKDATITLNQLQVASLLANAFFCTFPIQGGSVPIESENSKKIKYKRIAIPSISFEGLYEGNVKEGILPSQAAKLQCLIHYFTRVCDKFADNFSTLNNKGTNITFHRKVLSKAPDWANSEKLLTELIVSADELIEDVEEPHIEMDFANKMIGGGVLRRGCIQEEIRFAINTELIVSLLFTAKMEDHECVVITGAERYSKYTGYSYTFEWVDDFQDTKQVDEMNRISTCVVAIDALYFGVPPAQYLQTNIERELNKAYLGFDIDEGSSTNKLPIATGNWGCGAFGGYHDLKSIIQLLAAAEAGRDVTYFTFSHPGLAPSLQEVHTHLKAKNITVGQIFKAVVEIEKEFNNNNSSNNDIPQLFNLLIEKFE